MNRNYELIIQCDGKKHIRQDYIEDELFEEWNDLPDNHNQLDNITYSEVLKLNGKHVIFGVIECFEQSDECPYWYVRKRAEYSWKWIS